MKKLNSIIIAASIFVGVNAHGINLFAPKSYDDCILLNMEKAKTEKSASAIAHSCRNKFPDAPIKNESGVKICYLYWDGWKLVLGKRYKDPEFKTFGIERYGVKTVEFSLPKKMIDKFGKKEEVEAYADNFFKQNIGAVMTLCSFN